MLQVFIKPKFKCQSQKIQVSGLPKLAIIQQNKWDQITVLANISYNCDLTPLVRDVFKNKEGLLPGAKGRTWREADINYTTGYRGNDRILYSSDGLMYKTTNHYKTFTLIK